MFCLCFIVSGLTFRSLIHFEFIFVYGVRECSNFILLHVAVQFSRHHLLKRLSFLHCIFLPPFSKIRWPYVCGLSLGFLSCSKIYYFLFSFVSPYFLFPFLAFFWIIWIFFIIPLQFYLFFSYTFLLLQLSFKETKIRKNIFYIIHIITILGTYSCFLFCSHSLSPSLSLSSAPSFLSLLFKVSNSSPLSLSDQNQGILISVFSIQLGFLLVPHLVLYSGNHLQSETRSTLWPTSFVSFLSETTFFSFLLLSTAWKQSFHLIFQFSKCFQWITIAMAINPSWAEAEIHFLLLDLTSILSDIKIIHPAFTFVLDSSLVYSPQLPFSLWSILKLFAF